MKGWVILAAGIAAAVIATKILVENVFGIEMAPLVAGWIEEPGTGTALIIVALLLFDLFVPVPSSLVMVSSGALFGTVIGASLSFAGSLGCSIAGFELARRVGRGAAVRAVGEEALRRLERTFDRGGAGAVFITRPLPIVKETMSLLAGLSQMRRPTFIGAAVAGSIPEAALYTYAGASSREMGNLMPAVLIVMALAGAAWMLASRRGGA